ncbi:MAG: hypothetical protein NTU95_12450 [Methanothrix sp.]|nr:hypothetical protein [Methanothrix sp.]
MIIDHIMRTIKIYFLRAEGKREAASSDRLPPVGLGPPGSEGCPEPRPMHAGSVGHADRS